MSGKTDTEVVIGGKVYKLSGYESREYIQKVASYLNSKISELEQMEGYSRMTLDNKALLLELNIADDYFKTKEAADKTDRDIDHRDKEIYDLKHELITLHRKTDEMEKEVKQISAKNKELLLQKSKLESALEAALLGEIHSVKPGKNEKEDSESETEPDEKDLTAETVPEEKKHRPEKEKKTK